MSAKHLLESLIIKLDWNKEFYEYFSLAFNTFGLKSEGYVYKGKKLIISQDIQCKDAIDDSTYNYYIDSFIVKDGNKEIKIHTSNSDNIYFVPEFYEYYDQCRSACKSYSDDNAVVEMDMVELMRFPCLFIMEMRNNELSRTMDNIERLIDNGSVISKYDKNTILEEFIKQNLLGGIKLNSVHFEVLLMNQIRAVDDELELPDWGIKDVPYQMISLSKSLSNNRSIAIRLQSAKVERALLSPHNRKLNKPAMVDLFYMEKPQEYLDQGIITQDKRSMEEYGDIYTPKIQEEQVEDTSEDSVEEDSEE